MTELIQVLYGIHIKMLKDICLEILNRLEYKGLQTSKISFDELVDKKVGALSRPAVNISINSSTFKKVTMQTYKAIPVISLFIMVQDLSNEESRRFQIYDLLEEIVNYLILQNLGLELQDDLLLQGWTNVTDEKYAGAGYQVYQINFTCSFNFTKESDEDDWGEFESIKTEYYLNPNDDGVCDQEGLIDLAEIYGGTALILHSEDAMYGGRAGSTHYLSAIYGGKAN